MKAVKYEICLLVAASMFLLIAGCGYQLGSVMHPQIKTIAIAPIKNETIEMMATQFMRQSLAEQFELDNSLKVKGLEEADCVLYGKIVSVKTTSIGYDSHNDDQTYTPAEFSLEVKFEFVVIIPGRAKPLVNNRQVIGRASYQVAMDNDIARRRGIQQACREAAEQIVIDTVEAW
ncbi:MAG: hypothetical protein A2X48_08360 [Lentisphaerae bacterium GWF2_49_21]|nr:MAG: hypothetical protein A2X48_08360 [Lentisphaerae bacterium GWF2_49_21]